MESRFLTLQPAVELARSREASAAREMSDFQQRLTHQQAQLQQLLTFRAEYSEQFQTAGRDSISVRRLQDFVAFLGSLDRRIAHTQSQLQGLQQELQNKRQHWVASRARTQALEELIRRDRLEHSRAEVRREQAQSDEYALRGYRNGSEN